MMKKGILPKILLSVGAVVVIIAAVIFFYRYQIIQYSTDAIIRKLLPDYVKVDRIYFEFKNNKIVLAGFRILNPAAFSDKYLLAIDEVACGYALKGKNILDGFEVIQPVFTRPSLTIERLSDGRVNLQEMQKVIEAGQKKKPAAPAPSAPAEVQGRAGEGGPKGISVGNKTLPDVVKLPETFLVKEGKLTVKDHMVRPGPHVITFERVDSNLSLRLNPAYTGVLRAGSTGRGELNGRKSEVVQWNVTFDPTTPRLTMANRFDVSGVDITTFAPYYDRYSPFIIKKGRMSGTLVFDFDNGNIGSTNEIRLSDLSFSIKQGQEQSAFLDTTVPELVKYFTSSTGDIVFDFKIKGDMANPQFFLGPISKQALTSMAIDKVSAIIAEAANTQQSPPGQPTGDSQYEKTKALIDAVKGLVDKK